MHRNTERIVPRCDDADHAKRQAENPAALVQEQQRPGTDLARLEKTFGVLGVVIDSHGAGQHLGGQRFDPGFANIVGDGFTDRVGVVDQVIADAEDVAHPLRQRQRRPGRLRGAGAAEGVARFLDRVHLRITDDLAGGGIDADSLAEIESLGRAHGRSSTAADWGGSASGGGDRGGWTDGAMRADIARP